MPVAAYNVCPHRCSCGHGALIESNSSEYPSRGNGIKCQYLENDHWSFRCILGDIPQLIPTLQEIEARREGGGGSGVVLEGGMRAIKQKLFDLFLLRKNKLLPPKQIKKIVLLQFFFLFYFSRIRFLIFFLP